jgi:hypothetical protein
LTYDTYITTSGEYTPTFRNRDDEEDWNEYYFAHLDPRPQCPNCNKHADALYNCHETSEILCFDCLSHTAPYVGIKVTPEYLFSNRVNGQ